MHTWRLGLFFLCLVFGGWRAQARQGSPPISARENVLPAAVLVVVVILAGFWPA